MEIGWTDVGSGGYILVSFAHSNTSYLMSFDNLSSVSQNVLKFYQQLTGEERRVPFIFGRNNQ